VRSMRGVLAAFLSAAVAVLLAAPAAMAQGAPGGPTRNISVWQELHQEIEHWIESTGAREAFFRLGLALYMFLGMVQTYSAVIGTSSAGVAETVFRVIMAGFLLSLAQKGPGMGTSVIGQILGDAYAGFAGIGMKILMRSYSGGFMDVFKDLGKNLWEKFKVIVGVVGGLAAAIVLPLLVGGAAMAIMAIYGLFAAMYIVVQLFALVILSLALMLAPLSFAAFAYRGTSQWTWHWVKGVLNALLTVLLANMVAGAVAWFSIKGPEVVFRAALPQEAGPISESFVVGVLLPFLALVIAPFLGIMALLRVETVVAHFTTAFGDFTGTMEQLLTSRLIWRQFAARTFGRGGGPGPGGGTSGGTEGGGGAGGGGSSPRSTPPPPAIPVVSAPPAPGVQVSGFGGPPPAGELPAGPGWRRPPGGGPRPGVDGGPSGTAGPSGPGYRPSFEVTGAKPGGFAPADAPPGEDRPPGWQSLSEWSQKWFGVDLAPWQRDPSVPVPHKDMSLEQLKDIYSRAAAAEGMQVKSVIARAHESRPTVSITVEEKPENVTPGAAPRVRMIHVSMVEPREGVEVPDRASRKSGEQSGGLLVNVYSRDEHGRASFQMQWDGKVGGFSGDVKAVEGLKYSGDWRARVAGSTGQPGSRKGGGG